MSHGAPTCRVDIHGPEVDRKQENFVQETIGTKVRFDIITSSSPGHTTHRQISGRTQILTFTETKRKTNTS